MSIKQMMSVFENAISGTKVCWMRDERTVRASVMVIIPESNKRAAVAECSRRMAARARRTAEREAMRIGHVMSTGVFMRGECNGSVNAIGIADLELTPEIERRLSVSGIPQVH